MMLMVPLFVLSVNLIWVVYATKSDSQLNKQLPTATSSQKQKQYLKLEKWTFSIIVHLAQAFKSHPFWLEEPGTADCPVSSVRNVPVPRGEKHLVQLGPSGKQGCFSPQATTEDLKSRDESYSNIRNNF